jgi:Trypsin-co-occurring domain 1
MEREVEDRELITVSLEDGISIQVEARVQGREQDVAFTRFKFSDVGKAIGGMAKLLATATEKAKPAETEIQFGLDIGVETGHLIGILAGGSSSANLQVTLKWRSPGTESTTLEGLDHKNDTHN